MMAVAATLAATVARDRVVAVTAVRMATARGADRVRMATAAPGTTATATGAAVVTVVIDAWR